MISPEKLMILTSLQKLSSNVGDLVKIIGATNFEWLPKVQKIDQSGHTGLKFFLTSVWEFKNRTKWHKETRWVDEHKQRQTIDYKEESML